MNLIQCLRFSLAQAEKLLVWSSMYPRINQHPDVLLCSLVGQVEASLQNQLTHLPCPALTYTQVSPQLALFRAEHQEQTAKPSDLDPRHSSGVPITISLIWLETWQTFLLLLFLPHL